MKKKTFGLLLSLVLSSFTIIAQQFSFDYYNPANNEFTVLDWQMDQLIKESEERGLLILEVHKLNNLLKLDSIKIDILTDKWTVSEDYKNEMYIEKEFLLEKIEFQKDLLRKSEKIHSKGLKSISSLEWQIKKEKIKNKWLSISTSVTTVSLVAILIRQLAINK